MHAVISTRRCARLLITIMKLGDYNSSRCVVRCALLVLDNSASCVPASYASLVCFEASLAIFSNPFLMIATSLEALEGLSYKPALFRFVTTG